ncbi:methyltransferase domain-containing protein [Sphingomonas donggukensis]|uniref:Methyltransferase domain-containing protein n=1 Tax=Sphingomonas donggukensis TaxID=2949093 RepID=A0ABY4TW59_9SPHN|nr:methyltransferase domain-containing protein [Sphingomonas donggukensis]URW76578.1 methyltransferase domain-containing protein [Sphingomonas donggukensis]
MTSSTDWTGAVGDVWAAEWRRTDRSLADLSRHLDVAILAAAPPHPFRAFDIGCGAGATSLALATARPDATIIGIDLSEALVEVARWRADHVSTEVSTATVLPRRREPRVTEHPACGSGLPPAREHGMDDPARLNFQTADATQAAAGHAPVDLFVSRHGVMFFDDPVAAFTAFHAAAAPDARLVFSCFRDWSLNAFAAELAAAVGGQPPVPGAGPFAFAARDHVAAILATAGWRDAQATPVDFAYRAGAGEDPVADALGFFQRIGPAAPILRAADPADRPAMLARLRAVIEARRNGDTIDFPAAAWIWSATAQSGERP